MGGEPHQPAELGSVDGLPGMVIARKVSSVVYSLPPSPRPTAGALEPCAASVKQRLSHRSPVGMNLWHTEAVQYPLLTSALGVGGRKGVLQFVTSLRIYSIPVIATYISNLD